MHEITSGDSFTAVASIVVDKGELGLAMGRDYNVVLENGIETKLIWYKERLSLIAFSFSSRAECEAQARRLYGVLLYQLVSRGYCLPPVHFSNPVCRKTEKYRASCIEYENVVNGFAVFTNITSISSYKKALESLPELEEGGTRPYSKLTPDNLSHWGEMKDARVEQCSRYLNDVSLADNAQFPAQRILILTTILESIAGRIVKRPKRTAEERAFFKRMKQEVSGSNLCEDDKDSIARYLDAWTKMSIRESIVECAKLLDIPTYNDQPVEKFVRDNYNLRSRFSHGDEGYQIESYSVEPNKDGSNKGLTDVQLAVRARELREFVVQIIYAYANYVEPQ